MLDDETRPRRRAPPAPTLMTAALAYLLELRFSEEEKRKS
jgi:hypothetical protein